MANSVNSAEDICNLALIRLGQSPITTLQDGTAAAKSCNILYGPTRDEVLKVYPWRFASTDKQLAASGASPVWKFDLKYELPADCLFVQETDFEDTYDWQVKGGFLHTNATAPIYITYTKRVTDPTKFDPLFVTALVELLASKLAMPITRKSALEEKHYSIYEDKIDNLRSVDTQEGSQEELESDDLIDVR